MRKHVNVEIMNENGLCRGLFRFNGFFYLCERVNIDSAKGLEKM